MPLNPALLNGDALREVVPPRLGRPAKYRESLDDWRAPLLRDAESVSQTVAVVEPRFAPGDRIVGHIVVRPRYIARSYLPLALTRRLRLRVIGTQSIILSRTREGDENVGAYLLEVDAPRGTWNEVGPQLRRLTESTEAGRSLHHVEALRIPSAADKRVTMLSANATAIPDAQELILLSPDNEVEIRAAFLALVQSEQAQIHDACKLGRLMYYSLRGAASAFLTLSEFVYVRRALPLQRVSVHTGDRIVGRTVRPLAGYHASTTRPATRWRASLFELASAVPTGTAAFATGRVHGTVAATTEPSWVEHSAAVASAYAFGPLPNTPGSTPPATSKLEVVQVGDDHTHDPVTIGRRLSEALADSRVGPLINVSMGPREEIADGVVSAWTAALDLACAGGDRLCTVAIGNDGDQNPPLRLGPPADAANVVTVGSVAARTGAARVAQYSSHGPGRAGARRKPDVVAFGGSASDPFWVLPPDPASVEAIGFAGTSYAAPLVLRAGAILAQTLQSGGLPTAVPPWLLTRALIVHAAHPIAGPEFAVGGGAVELMDAAILATEDDTVRVLYAGVLPLKRVTRLRVPTTRVLSGRVDVRVTVCIAAPVEPADAAHYTQAGTVAGLYKVRADGTRDSLNALGRLRGKLYESDQRVELMKWETCFTFQRGVRGPFDRLELDLHALRRSALTSAPDTPAPYAAVITTRRPGDARWYASVRNVLRARIRPLVLPAPLRVTT